MLELPSYIINIDDEHRDIKELTEIIHDQLLPEVEVEIVTLAERLREEGVQKGALEIAQRMLKEGIDEAFVAKVTQLSVSQIKALQKKMPH